MLAPADGWGCPPAKWWLWEQAISIGLIGLRQLVSALYRIQRERRTRAPGRRRGLVRGGHGGDNFLERLFDPVAGQLRPNIGFYFIDLGDNLRVEQCFDQLLIVVVTFAKIRCVRSEARASRIPRRYELAITRVYLNLLEKYIICRRVYFFIQEICNETWLNFPKVLLVELSGVEQVNLRL